MSGGSPSIPSTALRRPIALNQTLRRPSLLLRALVALAVGALAACGSFEDKRIRELMPEKGFGTRAAGDAAAENYIGGRDLIQFLLPPTALRRVPERLM